jgi:hypothetical protein
MAADKEIELPWEMQEICKLLKTELRVCCARVEETSSLSREGRKARQRLKAFLAKLHLLAQQSGSKEVVDAVGKVRLPTFGTIVGPEQLPNWDSGGSLN